MILDAQNLYSDAQPLTGDAVSTNIIDHGAIRLLGTGEPLAILITVDVSAAGGGTLAFTLQTDADGALGSPTAALVSSAIADTALAAGKKFVMNIPPNLAFERYSRLSYDLTTMTGITLTAALVPLNFIDWGTEKYYPVSYTIAA